MDFACLFPHTLDLNLSSQTFRSCCRCSWTFAFAHVSLFCRSLSWALTSPVPIKCVSPFLLIWLHLLFFTTLLKALKLIQNRTHSPSALMQTWLTHPLWQCMPKVSWSHLILISANCYLLFLQMQSSYRGFYVPVDIKITYHTLTQWDPSVSALSSAQLCQPVYPPHSARQSHASQVLPSKSAVRSGLFLFLSG